MAENQLLSPAQAAEFLNVSIKTLEKWRAQNNGLEFFKFGRNVIRYSPEHLNKFLQQNLQGGK